MGRRISISPVGDYTGLMGPVVVTNWLGLWVIKSRPKRGKARKPQTAEQAEHSELFGKMNHILTPLRQLLSRTFYVPRKKNMTPFNAAVSGMMTQSLVEHEGKRYVDFDKVKLSNPKALTQQLWNPSATAQPGRRMTVSWELNPFPQKCSRLDDEVYIAYCGSESATFRTVYQKIQRKDLSLSFKLNSTVTGDAIYLFILVISADGKRVADSDYLGAITVMP